MIGDNKNLKNKTKNGVSRKKFINVISINSDKNKQFEKFIFFRNVSMYFKEYCENTTLHGFRYAGGNNRTISERIWWLLIITVSIVLCSLMISKAWDKWNINPILISISAKPTTIWQIPHPSITICPDIKFNQTIFNFTQKLTEHSWVNEQMKNFTQFADATLLCDANFNFNGKNDFANESLIDFFHEISFTWDEFIFQCQWGTSSYCNNFRNILTEDGICFTINSLDYTELFKNEFQKERYLNFGKHSDWSLQSGYKNFSKKNSYPKRPIFTGISEGLTILLTGLRKDLEYFCSGLIIGYKIFLQNPEEIPGLTHLYVHTQINEEINIEIQPQMTMTSESLINYPPSIRKCYFPNEKYLRFYKVYTQVNCELECLTNYTLKYCGCVAFYMSKTNETRFCASRKHRCIKEAKKNLLSEVIEKEIKQTNIPLELRKSTKSCDCFPACTSLTYNTVVFRASFDWQIENQMNISLEPEYNNRIVFYFKDSEFTPFIRNELYGSTDFIANCGGFLGLFIGFSFLSLLEIAYYLTLRIWCNIKRNGRKLWSLST